MSVTIVDIVIIFYIIVSLYIIIDSWRKLMVDSKRKGTRWEREVVDYLNKRLKNGKFKRIAGSGAFGQTMKEPSLLGDIKGEVVGFGREFKLEAKVGYGGSKQITFKKEWLDKIKDEAETTLSIPAVVCRFSNSRSGVENFIALDIDEFIYLVNKVTELSELLDDCYGE
jgi:hypothetical protein